jgi:type III restriction enzyme
VQKIYTANSENIMLEFTATLDLEKAEIFRKYFDKVIYKYDLKDFRLDGYSKDVFLYPSKTQNVTERMLQAVVLSQYRRKIAGKNGLNIKPVILMKSSKIAESKANFDAFHDLINNLKVADLKKITKDIEDLKAEHIMNSVFSYLETEKISLQDFVEEIKLEFSKEKCIEVNSKEESSDKQIIVNTLEDNSNPYRVIFAVDKLNEGWDVLNLFDIVRLYDKRDDRNGKAGTTTLQEAQLVGRGARYFAYGK